MNKYNADELKLALMRLFAAATDERSGRPNVAQLHRLSHYHGMLNSFIDSATSAENSNNPEGQKNPAFDWGGGY